MNQHFISESIRPVTSGTVGDRMAAGEPGLPALFYWRGKKYSVEKILQKWRELSPCTHKSSESYVRKHWFRFTTDAGREMTVYFERQPRREKNPKLRWWLFKTSVPAGD